MPRSRTVNDLYSPAYGVSLRHAYGASVHHGRKLCSTSVHFYNKKKFPKRSLESPKSLRTLASGLKKGINTCGGILKSFLNLLLRKTSSKNTGYIKVYL
jgi:hypothetical protein